jgi:hypothetical protein
MKAMSSDPNTKIKLPNAKDVALSSNTRKSIAGYDWENTKGMSDLDIMKARNAGAARPMGQVNSEYYTSRVQDYKDYLSKQEAPAEKVKNVIETKAPPSAKNLPPEQRPSGDRVVREVKGEQVVARPNAAVTEKKKKKGVITPQDYANVLGGSARKKLLGM